jgi:hypothetical protein
MLLRWWLMNIATVPTTRLRLKPEYSERERITTTKRKNIHISLYFICGYREAKSVAFLQRHRAEEGKRTERER